MIRPYYPDDVGVCLYSQKISNEIIDVNVNSESEVYKEAYSTRHQQIYEILSF